MRRSLLSRRPIGLTQHGSPGVTLLDLSHEITSGTTAYPGLPQPILTDYITHEQSRELYEDGYQFHTGRLCLVGQTGTYLDVPFHGFPDGNDLTGLDLKRVVNVPVTIIDTDQQEIGEECLTDARLSRRAVLFRTRWSRFWGTDTYSNGQHPYLSGKAARVLAEAGVSVVGIDSLNLDGTHTRARPAHYELLGAGIPVVEHLTNLTQLPDTGVRFTAVPAKIAGLGTFPVRAFATWSIWI
jgi:arylformamidase